MTAPWLNRASTRQTELGDAWVSRAIARTWRPTRAAVVRINRTILGSSGGLPKRLPLFRATSNPASVRSFIVVTGRPSRGPRARPRCGHAVGNERAVRTLGPAEMTGRRGHVPQLKGGGSRETRPAAEGINRASDQRMGPDRVGADLQQPLGQRPKASRIPATVRGQARRG